MNKPLRKLNTHMIEINDWENMPTVTYDDPDGGNHVFIRICPNCGRYVKADESLFINGLGDMKPNATCKKCGRVKMPYIGLY